MVKIKLSKPFDLDATVTCGQIFRFNKLEDSSYDIVLKDRVINVRKDNDYLLVTSNKDDNLKEVATSYFDLDNDYSKINDAIKTADSKIIDAVDFSLGLNMIKQDPFETCIAYIISTNNGVPQITSALNNIAKKYGKKVEFNNKEYYLFPSYEDLKDASEEEYRACKVGFRDKYLTSFVNKVNSGEINLESYYNMDTQTALEELQKNSGIGPKVASCILLFAYQKYDVFPIDTWVKKVMKMTYNIEGENKIRDFAKNTYGKYSGIAIQYMFNYGRNKHS